ncbi:MAG TPA: hypothetical protein VJ438_06085 [Candidatus Nanoarchaeia archaeon]|nr:hypothetical protein [Candidatus Nanoarchaeia archaeon]
MRIKIKNKEIEIIAKKCNSLRKITGLMFRTSKTEPLLFEFNNSCQAIHSFFVFFPFYAIWLDKDNKLIEIKKVKPFTFHVKPSKPFSKLLEIPVNEKYAEIITTLSNSYKT